MPEVYNPFRRSRDKDEPTDIVRGDSSLETLGEGKSFAQRILPVFACGAGLFSDGYINNVRTP
jgi:hypothetical protein